jgi:uncharacterized protein involved in oxidation of intracellular sulfur
MKLCIIANSNEPELVFNAFRLANHSRAKGDEVDVFLMANAVELESIRDERFDIIGQSRKFISAGGKISACGNCLQLRKMGPSELFQIGNLDGLYEAVMKADKTVTF